MTREPAMLLAAFLTLIGEILVVTQEAVDWRAAVIAALPLVSGFITRAFVTPAVREEWGFRPAGDPPYAED